MMYKVIKFFTDLHDKDYPYNVGDIFPREGISVTDGRIAELAGSDNKQGEPLIKLVKKAPAKKAQKATEEQKAAEE